jgi:uncharacterized lipoprotein
MRRTAPLLSSILATVLAAGCGTFESPSFRSPALVLEIPPDLTAPNTTGATRVPVIINSPVSAQTADEFEAFQSAEQQAEYQAFLLWRETHSDSPGTSIAAFHKSKRLEREAKLIRDGVLVALDDVGREVLLISDSLGNSWSRIDTALINLNLQLLNSRKSTHTFRISYRVGREGGTDRGWRNWTTRLTGRAIYELRLTEAKGLVTASVFDRHGNPVISPVADTFVRRLAAQLKTFVGKREQFVTGGVGILTGLSLRKQSNGQLQLVVPDGAEGAWKRLSKALRNSNFSVDSRDRDALSFWIRYIRSGKKDSQSILTRLGLQKEKTPSIIERYRIQLVHNEGDDVTAVTVWNIDNEPARTNEDILTVLFETLKN